MDRPILFNTEMVKAIMEGRKTQTRRIVVPRLELRKQGYQVVMHNPGYKLIYMEPFILSLSDGKRKRGAMIDKPCTKGDILWVRETWQHVYTFDDNDQPVAGSGRYIYYADNPMPFDYWVDQDTGEHKEQMPWKPSIHMPKEAARIFLLVKDVRVEKLHDMDEDAAIAEGFADSPAGTDSPLQRFTELWDKTIKREDLREFGYHANPWVWVIEFECCEKPKGWPRCL